MAALTSLSIAACGGRKVITEGLVLTNVTLIDGTDRGARIGMSVAVAGGRIVAVGPNADLDAGPSASVIDGTGKFLIPGLWDMHVHLAVYEEQSFPLFLANGVTTVREVGGGFQRSVQLRRESGEGFRLGPSLLIAGPTLDSEVMTPAVPPSGDVARMAIPDSATAVAVVDSLARAGVDLIKVHAATPRSAYFAVLEAAKRRGLFVAGHVPDSVMPREAIAAGQRTLEHGSRHPFANSVRGRELTEWMLDEMQQYQDTVGAVRPLGLGLVRWAADDSAQQAFDPETAQEFAEYAARHEVWFDPTLAIYQLALRNDEPGIRDVPEVKYAPRAAREMQELPPPNPDPTAEDIATGRRRWAAALASFAPLVRAGAKFVAGTDVPVYPLVPGFSLHRELRLLREMGLTPLQVLQAATRNAAEASGRLSDVGTIEVGKTADLVLLDADPLADVANTSRIRAVVTRGRLLDRAALDAMLADAEAFARER